MIKKRVSLIICIMLVISIVLTGCGTGSSNTGATKDTGTKKIEYTDYKLIAGKPFAGQTIKLLNTAGDTAQWVAMQKLTPEFTKLTGINVVWDFTPWDAYQEKFMTEATAGGGNYDIMAMLDTFGPAAKNYLEPLDPYIQRDGIDMSDYPQGFVQSEQVGTGKNLGIPIRGHAMMLYYRKDIFQKLGLNPPKTWDEVVADAKKIEQQTGMKGLAVPYGISGGQNLMVWFGMLWGNGSDIFDKNWKPIFNNPKGIEATEKYVGFLTKDHIVPNGSDTFSEADANNEMLQGRAAMNVTWSWLWTDKFQDPKQAVNGVYGNVGFVPAPVFNGQESPISYSVNFSLAISKDSQHKDAAWEYIKFITSKEMEKKMVTDKSDPKASSGVTMHLSNMLDPDVNKANGGIQKATYDALKTSKALPVTPQWLEVQSILEVAMNKMATGAPVKATMDQAAADVTDVMKKAGYYN